MYKTRLLIVREAGSEIEPTQFDGPAAVANQFRDLRDASQEEFHVIAVNAKHKIIGSYMVSRGSLITSIVHPREVFKYALSMNAQAFIVVHNHPSGDVTPSKDDIATTRRLRDAGDLLGIPLLDHVIIGANGWNSWNSGSW